MKILLWFFVIDLNSTIAFQWIKTRRVDIRQQRSTDNERLATKEFDSKMANGINQKERKIIRYFTKIGKGSHTHSGLIPSLKVIWIIWTDNVIAAVEFEMFSTRIDLAPGFNDQLGYPAWTEWELSDPRLLPSFNDGIELNNWWAQPLIQLQNPL